MSVTTSWNVDLAMRSAASRGAETERTVTTSSTTEPSIHDLPWTPYERAEAVPVVVLLLDHRAAVPTAVKRATRMSDALRARLYVILALPIAAASSPSPLVSQVTELLRRASPRHGHDLEVVHGPITELGPELAREEQAILVVVDEGFGAAPACRLADRLRVPVLIAREPRADGEWIAATDMQHLHFPVLSTARELAQAADRDVTFFHNTLPAPMFVADPMAAAGAYIGMLRLQEDAAVATRSRLERLAGQDRRVRSMVTRSGDTIDVLLDLARKRDADMVVVGHARRSWWRRLGRSTSERIIARTRRSVLIVPIERL